MRENYEITGSPMGIVKIPIPKDFFKNLFEEMENQEKETRNSMGYTKISPLGARNGLGTFEMFFDTSKYISPDAAQEANDVAIVDFVLNDDDVIYFEAYHIKSPEDKKHVRLQIQHFPCGVDVMDDQAACDLANEFIKQDQS